MPCALDTRRIAPGRPAAAGYGEVRTTPPLPRLCTQLPLMQGTVQSQRVSEAAACSAGERSKV